MSALLLTIGAASTLAAAQTASPIASVTLSSTRVTGGATVTGIVTLTSEAGDGGVQVRLESNKTSLATLPDDRVVIQAGTRTASFVVQTKPVAGNPNAVTDPPSVDITAMRWLPGSGPANPPRPLPPPMTVRLTVLPAALASLTVSPSSVPGGTAATGQVQLTGLAVAPGLTIALASKLTGNEPSRRTIQPGVGQSGPASVPTQVTIPAGASSATFQITTRQVTAATPVQITASYGAFGMKSALLTITPLSKGGNP